MWIRSALKPVTTLESAWLGILVGTFEAAVIPRWDFLMHDPSPSRVALALGWGGLILGVTTTLWIALEAACRRRRLVAVTLFLVVVFLARIWVDDRFHAFSALIVPLALGLTFWRSRHPVGMLAILLALVALWGRIPNYPAEPLQQMSYLLPGALLVLLLNLLPRRPWLLLVPPLAVALALGVGARAVRMPRPVARGPNILFILVDTLRRDHLQPYAKDGAATAFARVAREGVLFEDAITVVPKTTASVASFFTGRYPVSHGLRTLKGKLKPSNVTVAEILRERGYDTAAFVHNGWVMRGRGFEQGFDQFWSFWEVENPYGPLGYSAFLTALDGLILRRAAAFAGNTNAGRLTDRALGWLAEPRDRPFFAYVHYFDPHWPYRPPGHDGECLVNNIRESNVSRSRMIHQNDLPEEENQRARALYRHEVDYNDDQSARLLGWLDEIGIADDTIVIYTADHGHHLGEQDYYFHHGDFLYEPSIRIPLAMRWPGRLEGGRTIAHQIRSIDVVPTLLDLLAIEAPASDGQAALFTPGTPAFLETDSRANRRNTRRFVHGSVGRQRGVRTATWKLIFTPHPSGGLWELYHLATDPKESANLIGTDQASRAVVMPLVRELQRWILPHESRALGRFGARFDRLPLRPLGEPGTTAPPPVPAEPEEELSPADREMLRALGYID